MSLVEVKSKQVGMHPKFNNWCSYEKKRHPETWTQRGRPRGNGDADGVTLHEPRNAKDRQQTSQARRGTGMVYPQCLQKMPTD